MLILLVGCSLEVRHREEADSDSMLELFLWLIFYCFCFVILIIGEGSGDAFQYSCLENPRDRGAWWAAIYGVTQSWTWLKRLSSSSSSSTTLYTKSHIILFLQGVIKRLVVINICTDLYKNDKLRYKNKWSTSHWENVWINSMNLFT